MRDVDSLYVSARRRSSLLTTSRRLFLLRRRYVVRGIPIASFLVDERPAPAPPGFDTVRNTFDALPREIALADGWSVVVYVPTGIARAWLDEDADAIVCSSADEFVPHGAVSREG